MAITQLLQRQPGLQLDFQGVLDPNPILETIVSFANSEGGQIVVGANASGRVTGGIVVEDIENLLQMSLYRIRPPLRVEVETFELPQGTVLVLNVPRSNELHSLIDGRVLARRGNQNVLQTGTDLTSLVSSRAGGDYELEPIAGTSIDDFDMEVVAEYVEYRRRRQPRGFVGSTEALLRQIGALTAEGVATVMGLLLFGREPQIYLPQSGLTFVKFASSDRRGEHGQIGYGRREDINGPLARIIERAWQVAWEEMDKQAVVKGLTRQEQTEYPGVSVREALVNAVAHRDYRVAGRRIEMLLYRDRLEVTSPGGLPGYITLQNIVDEHFSRNPRLVNGLLQWGYIEELGLGIDKMIEAMIADGHPPPDFKASPHAFTVTLRKGREVGQPGQMQQWEHNMNERQMQALQFVQQYGRITNSDYRNLCPNVSSETLRLDLADLVDKGLLLKIGDKKGTHYVLKRRGGQS
ncbi:MAG: putative DNA binding domain-containing protein [Caldilineales bacterium]|nr:putative DNA binding domain-containing protein [Caldilineales bacterium]